MQTTHTHIQMTPGTGLTLARRLALCTVIIAVWAITHRYGGVRHDGVLYAGQALFRLHPEHFAGDLFFAFGSQDSYSLFGPLYALLIAKIGLGYASLVLMVLTQLAWLLAAALLASRLLRGEPFWLSLLLLAVLARFYGADGVFSYAETFVTARVVAEPFVLAGLALLLMQRPVAGNSLLGTAAVLHPVIALPAVVAAFALQARPRLTVAASVIAMLLVAALLTGAAASWGPLQLMDPDWYQVSMERNPFVFVDKWTPAELAEPLFWGALLFLAATCASGSTRKFWFSILFAGLIGFALAAVAARWPLALLIQMQTWRAEWLLKVCGIVAAVWVVRALLQRGPPGQVMTTLLAACLLGNDEWSFLTGAAAALLYPGLAGSRRFNDLLGRQRTALIAGIVLASAVPLLLTAAEIWSALAELFRGLVFDFPRMSVLALEQPRSLILLLGALAILLTARWRTHRLTRVAATLSLVSIILICGISWKWVFQSNSSPIIPYAAAPDGLRALIPPGSLSYLEGEHNYLWFALDRASYASHHQAAGVIFSRSTAMEARRRLDLTSAMGTPNSSLTWRSRSMAPVSTAPPTTLALSKICQDPILDYVILQRPPRGDLPITAVASIPVQFHEGGETVSLLVYECTRLRS